MTSLDVSNNLRLTNLLCQITEIEELDVSRNVALSELVCGSTNIRELDVSHNTVLRQLSCGDTLIHGLDVTKNVQLEDRLMCDRCPLAYLNLGALQVDGFYIYAIPESTELTLYVTEDHFDITEQYPGIDVTKIHNLTGAAIDGSVVTDYTSVKPINYDYDCGTNNGVQQIMNVSIYIEGFNYDPIITARDRTVTVGEPFDPLEGVSASDREDGNLTAALSVTENTVNTRKAGEYQVTYEVSDSQGATVTKTVKVTVKAADTAGKETKPTDTGKKGSTAQKSVQTGDDMNLSLWGITLGVSASLIAGLSRRKRKQIR